MAKTRKYSFVTLLIAIALVTATWMWSQMYFTARIGWFGEDGSREIAPILQKYGAHRFSRNVEEWVIRDFFQDRHNGVFLDVGANDYRNESNTYYLETELGWSGVAIDALEEFAQGYQEHRPQTRFFAGFVSDVGDSAVQFFVPEQNKLVASVSHEFTERAGTPGYREPFARRHWTGCLCRRASPVSISCQWTSSSLSPRHSRASTSIASARASRAWRQIQKCGSRSSTTLLAITTR